ncbi:DUF350 domain-containing protein [Marinomonas mediterranea]|jgi:Predicted membrane protein|uniref:DUF350 domain-containing protein n=1 Tax=Marinomonas mediterranea (strain ATCC 700492 / JCM 21426 / NBRC 103028 / MMB-1) TaxID=717774 RepID=F2K3P6_MARM1|nr:DUF350 domain-containing protein [Marinomonas mediterranea]ADZ92485.1 protein of unknown function DUF350 [Marinomonas mediterranea MMB-1]WCN10431.1 DUF350 domain-containing protein [Marinomonas mediterranea]WCN14479.1 DUF350 domain-containing protein [Marinomonas mediterranea]WCN18530.1 DUF350 domain-containing protein [Marinomonas mediterranea MMB-1]
MDPQVQDLLISVGNFGGYFGLALLFVVVFTFVYSFITPHDEWKLIKSEQNTAASIGLGGAIIGFSIALGGAASNSVSIVDFAIWGLIALVAQSLAFAVVRFIFMPKIVARIIANEVSAGIILASVSVSVGVLNSACMTY